MSRSLITESLRVGSHQLISSGSGLYVYDVNQGAFPFLISSHTGTGIQIRHVIVNDKFARFIYTNNQSSIVYGFHTMFVKKGDSVNVFDDIEVIPHIYKTVLVQEANTNKIVNEVIQDTINNTDSLVTSKAIQDELTKFIQKTDPLITGSHNKTNYVMIWDGTKWTSMPISTSILSDANITFNNNDILRVKTGKIKNEPLATSMLELDKIPNVQLIKTELNSYLRIDESSSQQYSVLSWNGSLWTGQTITWDHLHDIKGSLQENNLLVYRNGKLETTDILTNYSTTAEINNTLENYLNDVSFQSGDGDYLYYNGEQWIGKPSIKDYAEFGTEDSRLLSERGLLSYLNNEKDGILSDQSSSKIATSSGVINQINQNIEELKQDFNLLQLNDNFRNVVGTVGTDEYTLIKSANTGHVFQYISIEDIKNDISNRIGTGVMSVEISSGSGIEGDKGPVLYYTPNNGTKTEANGNVGIVAFDKSTSTLSSDGAGSIYFLKFNTITKMFELQKSSTELTVDSIKQSSSQFELTSNGNIDCTQISSNTIDVSGVLTTSSIVVNGNISSSASGTFTDLNSTNLSATNATLTTANVTNLTISGTTTLANVTSDNLTLTSLNTTTLDASTSITSPSITMDHGNSGSTTLQTNISDSGIVTNMALSFFSTGTAPTFSHEPNVRIREGDNILLTSDRKLQNLSDIESDTGTYTSLNATNMTVSGTTNTNTISCIETGTFDSVNTNRLNFTINNDSNVVRDANGIIQISFNDSFLYTGSFEDNQNISSISQINIDTANGVPANGFEFNIVYKRPSGVSSVTLIRSTFYVSEAETQIETKLNINSNITILADEMYLITGKKLELLSESIYFVSFQQFY